MVLAITARPSVHATVAQHLIYVRRSYKEATAADVSDEMQEAACRALVPAGAPVRVISDSGGHQSGFSGQRDGYKALLAAIASGQAASVVVYDLSRLARNALLMLDLRAELERRQVPLLVANMPAAKFDGATGRYMFGQLAMAAQLQLDLDSERMSGMQRRLFEDAATGVTTRSVTGASGIPRAASCVPGSSRSCPRRPRWSVACSAS